MYYVRTLLSVVCQVGWGRCAPCENTVERECACQVGWGRFKVCTM